MALHKRLWAFVCDNLLLVCLTLAMVAGLVLGFSVRSAHPHFGQDKRSVMYMDFPGELLMRMLKMIVMPIIVASMISGVANLPQDGAKRTSVVTFFYFTVTLFLATIVGAFVVLIIGPGYVNYNGYDERPKPNQNETTSSEQVIDTFLDLIRNVFPSNVVVAGFRETSTQYKTVQDETSNQTYYDYNDFYLTESGSTNVLGLITISISIGICIGMIGEQGWVLKEFFSALEEVVLKLVIAIIWYSPIGICFLLAARIVSMEDPGLAFYQLGIYIVTVLVGLVIHCVLVLGALYAVCTRKNPFMLLVHSKEVLLTALATASSSATLPVTLRVLESDEIGVSRSIGRFVAPVGAVINMSGTALYETVAAIFIAQYNNIYLSYSQIITVCIVSVAAAVGAASVPEGGLVTLIIVLTALALPTHDIGLLLAVDWLVDRFRTVVNVWADVVIAAVIEVQQHDSLITSHTGLLTSQEGLTGTGSVTSSLTNVGDYQPYHNQNSGEDKSLDTTCISSDDDTASVERAGDKIGR